MHGLPTLASRNHQFDLAAPIGGDYESGGMPAPSRDRLDSISGVFDLFEFDD